MKSQIRYVIGLVLLVSFFGLGIVCCFIASGTHFLVTDAVGDAREMQDLQVSTSFWRDWLGYLPFYIPAAIVGLVALLMGYGSFRLLSKTSI